MKPIGLIFKHYEINPFTGCGSGELMIVHLCLNCGIISPNRIAGDDNEIQLLKLLEEHHLNHKIVRILSSRDIKLLTLLDKKEVMSNLFGCGFRLL
jgi:hypothetical protein